MNAKIELTGFIERIKDAEEFKNNFRKRELILDLEKGGKFENQVAITFVNDKCSVLDAYNAGDRVTVGVFPQGRSYLKPGGMEKDRRWFNEFRGWEIRTDVQQTMKTEDVFKDSGHEPYIDDNSDDLPF